ncbi:MAG: hypothetical protein AB7S26_06590 [Sandaracinaceae bacterium]
MRRTSIAIVALAFAAPAAAQEQPTPTSSRAEVVTARPLGVYAGVEAGEAQPPPAYGRVIRRQRARGRRRAAQILTWPGFSPLGDGGSRFFIQTTDPVQPEVRVEEGRVVVLFRGTSIHVRNSGRWLNTQFFNTPVQRARLERRRRDMAFVMYMRVAGVQPRISHEVAPGGNFHYTYIDFPPGDYAPVIQPMPDTIERRAPDSWDQPPAAPAREVDPTLDDETPPPVR